MCSSDLNSAFETGIRNPLDEAILGHPHQEPTDWRKRDEIPFDFERRRLSVVAETADRRLLIVKGAPESVFACCTQLETGDGPAPLSDDALARARATFEQLGDQGFRTLAIAYRPVPEQPAYRVADETGLTLAGFLAFSDPPLADAAETIEALRRDGVRIKILTGDSERVALHLCKTVGLDPGRIVRGEIGRAHV